MFVSPSVTAPMIGNCTEQLTNMSVDNVTTGKTDVTACPLERAIVVSERVLVGVDASMPSSIAKRSTKLKSYCSQSFTRPCRSARIYLITIVVISIIVRS